MSLYPAEGHVAMGVPMGQPVFSSSTPAVVSPAPPAVSKEQARAALRQLGFPAGLSDMAHASVKSFPLRIWIVDNSGSMAAGDGKMLKQSGTVQKMQSCTRWQELCATCERVAELATALGARTDFHLLNRVSDGKHLSIASGAGAALVEPLGPSGDMQAASEKRCCATSEDQPPSGRFLGR